MQHVEKRFEVDVPASMAYNQWTQLEDFPRVMEGVKEVRKVDDTRVRWCASVGGVEPAMDYEPGGVMERAGDAMGFVSHQLDRTIDDFRRFLERRGAQTGDGRPGSIPGGTPGARG